MRIAFVVSLFPKLSETFILKQAVRLIELGHEVEILAQSDPGEAIVHEEVDRLRLRDRVAYLRFDVPESGPIRWMLAALVLLRHGPKNPALALALVKMVRARRLGWNYFFALVPCIGRRYDVIHCHFAPNGIVGVRMNEYLGLGARVVTSVYGDDITGFVVRRGAHIYDELFAKGALFLPICSHFRERMMSLGCPAERIRVYRIGIDLGSFGYVERDPAVERPIRVLTVGRLSPKKGHATSIKAIAALIRGGVDLTYRVVGDGPLLDELVSLARSEGIEERVEFAGAVDNEALREAYRAADIFLLASETSKDGDQEGAPSVILEAQAIGLPVVATLHSGIPEIVEDGVGGLLVPEGDVDALAGALGLLAGNAAMRRSFGEAGRRFVVERFDHAVLRDQNVEIYSGLLARGADC